MNKYDWPAQRARSCPERIALVDADHDRSWSYAGLHRMTTELCEELELLGVGQGDRVGFLGFNMPEVFGLLFACGRLGATLVPLNWRLSSAELEVIVADAGLCAMVFDKDHEALASSLGGSVGRLRLGPSGTKRWKAEAKPGAKPEVSEEPAALMLYTSGTTGKPKGAMLPWRQIEANAINTTLACNLSSDDRCLAFLPLFHTGGMNVLATPLLWRGGTVVVSSRFDPAASLSQIRTHQVSTVIAVPTMYEMLVEAGLYTDPAPSLRLLLCGGAPCPPELIEAMHERGLGFRQGYGLTEAGPNLFTMSPLQGPHRVGSVGRPTFLGDVRLVDDEGNEAGPDQPGELWVRGPHVMSGYFQRPEANAETLVDGWLRTGDYLQRSEDGFFRVVGRKKEMFISGGENVYPAEVEAALHAHPQVHEVAVVGVDDERWGQVGLAVVVADGELDPAALRAWAKERLASYKTPRHVRLVAELPKNASGKIIRADLAKLLGDQGQTSSSVSTATSST